MATPANRVPVRIARGTKANLDTAMAAADLKEGEICYAEDQNALYVVESATLVRTEADFAGTSIDALLDVDTTTVAPVDGEVLAWDNAASNWEPYDIGIEPRSTVTQTTASIADGAADDVTFSSTGKAGQFIKVTTDRAAWVTIYNTTAARTADTTRPETDDPTPGSGVLLEVITTGADTVQITPTSGYYNDESTPLSELYAKVVNKSGATSTVQVDIVLIPLE